MLSKRIYKEFEGEKNKPIFPHQSFLSKSILFPNLFETHNMSFNCCKVYASLPKTTRGKALVIHSDPKNENLLYVNGNSVFIRNITDPSICDVYTQHTQATTGAKYSPDGYYIASSDISGKVRIWDTTQKEHILKCEYRPLSSHIRDMDWTGDSKRIIVGGESADKFAHVFAVDTGTSVGEIMGASKAINSVSFRRQRPFRAVVASEDNSVYFYEGPPFRFSKSKSDHTNFVNVVRYSHDGNMFVSGGADGKIFGYEGKTSELLGNYGNPAHSAGVYAISWKNDNTEFVSVSADKSMKIWNVSDRTLKKSFQFDNVIQNILVGCHWMNEKIIVVNVGGDIIQMDNELGEVRRIVGHNKAISTICFLNDKNKFISGGSDGKLVQWNLNDSQNCYVQQNQQTNQIKQIIYLSSINRCISCGFDDKLHLINLDEKPEICKSISLSSQPTGITSINQSIILVSTLNSIDVFDVDKSDLKLKFSHKISFESSCINAAGNGKIAIGSQGTKKFIKIYELNNNDLKEVSNLTIERRENILFVKFSPNHRWLTIAESNHLRCYDMENKMNEISSDIWCYHSGKITSIAWSPSSNYVASCGIDTNIFIYSPNNPKKCLLQIRGAHPLSPKFLYENMNFLIYLTTYVVFLSSITTSAIDENGYILYCPCMGRFGNQAEQFIGALEFAKKLDRTLVLPPWIEYRPGVLGSERVPFDHYFDVSTVKEYHRAMTMEDFMKDLAPKIWSEKKRYVFCYSSRTDSKGCDAKNGNPFGPFWDHFNVEFVHDYFYHPLHFDLTNGSIESWKKRFSSKKFPVLAFTGTPGTFPSLLSLAHLQKYLKYSKYIEEKGEKIIKKHLKSPFLAIHLRRGQDFINACEHSGRNYHLFSSAQCLGESFQYGKLTKELCYCSNDRLFSDINDGIKEISAKSLFIASDSQEVTELVEKKFEKIINVFHYDDIYDHESTHIDLYILTKADLAIVNCISTFSAFAVRERQMTKKPTKFFGFDSGNNSDL
ncbi:hypothetical protein SNEBB_006915 [Seison nebaliae]|nr:hypothetical protein SNEBB_006915 [Seison nebaliae]